MNDTHRLGVANSRPVHSRKFVALAICLLALASAMVMQEVEANQTSHYALVRALAAGTPRIHRGETADAALFRGHYYARKAPGLAMFTLPWYEGLRGVGLDSPTHQRTEIWKLGLFGSLLPFVVLLVLVVVAVERVVPRYGGPTAVLLGAGTLLFPFSALYFDHVLSALLAFSAFVLLMVEREAGPRLWQVGAAGAAAGLAVVVEFPLVIVVAALGLVYVPGRNMFRRLGWYAAGVLVGVLPLAAFNMWAFGSPTAIPYAHALGGDNKQGLWGVQLPSFRGALTLLLSSKGLFVLAPLTVAALAGLPGLWRAGRRREALVCAGIPLAFLVWNSGYFSPFGGNSPGPRFLVPVLPFLALPLALALRACPLAVGVLAIASSAVMWLVTTTQPLTSGDLGISLWLHLLRRATFSNTILTPLGVGSGWLAVVPVAVVFSAAVVLALIMLGRAEWSRAPLAAAALLAWGVVAVAAPRLLPVESGAGTVEGTLAVVLLFVGLALGLYLGATRAPRYLLVLLPAALLAVPRLSAHPRWSLLVAALTLCVTTAVWAGTAPPGAPRLRARLRRSAQPS